MPAVNAFIPQTGSYQILNHYHQSSGVVLCCGSEEKFGGYAEFIGFICTQGARFLDGAKLGKIRVQAITNGDGQEDCVWRLVPKNESVYAMILLGFGNPKEQCYLLVDDNGWPILTGATPPDYIPPEAEYVRAADLPLHFGKGSL